MFRLIASVLVSGVLLGSCASAHAHAACSFQDEVRADKLIDSVKNWNDLHAIYRTYNRCDDGEVSEGFSDAVGTLLADHWDLTPQLISFSEQDPDFKRFVFAHITVLISQDQDAAIVDHATNRCFPGRDRFCEEIIYAVKNVS